MSLCRASSDAFGGHPTSWAAPNLSAYIEKLKEVAKELASFCEGRYERSQAELETMLFGGHPTAWAAPNLSASIKKMREVAKNF